MMRSDSVLVRASVHWEERVTEARELRFFYAPWRSPFLGAACRHFTNEKAALKHWNSSRRCRPEFVSAVQAFFEAVRRGEVGVVEDGLEKKIVLDAGGNLVREVA